MQVSAVPQLNVSLDVGTTYQDNKADTTNRERSTGHRHDWAQTDGQELQPWRAVSTLLSLVCTVTQMWWPQIEFKSKFSADWPMSHARRDKGQQEKSRISRCCHNKETADRQKVVLQKNHGQAMLKTSSVSDLKRPMAPKILDSLNTMMQRTTNKNAAGLHRKYKRSVQPKKD